MAKEVLEVVRAGFVEFIGREDTEHEIVSVSSGDVWKAMVRLRQPLEQGDLPKVVVTVVPRDHCSVEKTLT